MMRGTHPGLCLAYLLLAAASVRGLRCTQCSVLLQKAVDEHYNMDVQMSDKAQCEGPIFPCSQPRDVCAAVYVSAKKYDGSNEIFFKRQCLEPQNCNTSGSMTNPGWKISYSVTCCGTEGCTPHQPVLPVPNTKKNGVYCPACYATAKECHPTNAMACSGEETHCLTLRTTSLVAVNHVFGTGCATENMCGVDQSMEFLKKPKSIEFIHCARENHRYDLRPGHFLWCYICHDYNVDNCMDKPFMCAPDEDVCVFERTRNIYDGRDDIEITKRCGRSTECSRAGTIRSGSKIIMTNSTCCDQNTCTAPFPELPSTSEDKNGLVCPTCFVPNSDRCLGRQDLKCMGNEKRCVHFIRTEMQDVFSVTESLHGCTTDQICEAGSTMTHPKGHYYKTVRTDVICNAAFTHQSDIVGIVIFFLCLLRIDIFIF